MDLRTKSFLLAAVLSALSGCSAKTACGGDSVSCGGVCVDAQSDNLHCGACGNACGSGTICMSGVCECAASGQLSCGGACVDPRTSEFWCGASGDCSGAKAGAICAPWETCQAGACACPTAGQLSCGGACVDPRTSVTHCGASGDCTGANAGAACPPWETCHAGACACPAAGQVSCGGACVDPQTSASYCGASGDCAGAHVGTICAAGQICQAGSCVQNCTPVPLDLTLPFATDLPAWIGSFPNPQAPTGFWTSSAAPLSTNTSWENLVLGTGENRMDFLPYQIKAEPAGWLDVGKAPLDNTSDAITVRNQMQLVFGANEFGGATTRKVLSYDLLSVTLRYSDTAGTMTAPLVQGMPYVTVQYAGTLRPKITPGLDDLAVRGTIASVNGSTTPGAVPGTKFKLVLGDGSTWLLYASPSITFNWSHGDMAAASAFAGTLRLANLPSPAGEAVLDAHAAVIPLGGEPKVGIACDVATLRFVYRTTGTGTLLLAAMPHQVARMTSSATTTLTYATLNGTLTGVEAPTVPGEGSTWTMTLPLSTITWSAPRPIAPAHDAAVRSALNVDKDFVPDLVTVDTDPYFGGKQLAKLARLALIADDLGEAATATTLRGRLRGFLAKWLDGTNGNPFVYDTTWGGVVTTRSLGDPNIDFGQGRYNDHHFHYGYFLYAAAALAKGDPTFAPTYGPGLLALVRDIANPSGGDPKFPRFRHMDFFRSHSWARGLDVAIDQNQESTSEAVNAWYGMYLLGLATGIPRMSDIGRLLLALELDGARTYWQIRTASTIYQDPFKQNMCVGRLFETAASFDTFFGGTAPQFVYGIQMLPYTPVSEALLSPAWVGEAWPKMAAAAAGADQQWAGLLYMAHATIARETAWSEVFPLTAWDNGNSQTNTFWWVATRPLP